MKNLSSKIKERMTIHIMDVYYMPIYTRIADRFDDRVYWCIETKINAMRPRISKI